ncbi:hypothetical protein P775_01925 [Puniceibacterium antarcticum]|uniref:Uncharacterized protein n=1 Tax=Puniceibacterium antarcticum TaxID=1206336 RepID=A0A2G8RK10_9RHOB|nr:hypothetical protein P775_01925 [Puniceibacterium antarcticum]
MEASFSTEYTGSCRCKVANRRLGTFHFAVQDPTLEDLLAKIVSAVGKQRMPVREYFPD